ncbi:MAG TPA: hypothetical protein VNK73_12790 [Actinomycetota bacterium]|jgi:hypothetical protein|nr:hypothetical protein [Actinomycetota bacterium]
MGVTAGCVGASARPSGVSVSRTRSITASRSLLLVALYGEGVEGVALSLPDREQVIGW